MTHSNDISLASRQLQHAHSVAVLTGAGISEESDIPTLCGPDGKWSRCNLEDLATPKGFERNPKLVWEWYTWRRNE